MFRQELRESFELLGPQKSTSPSCSKIFKRNSVPKRRTSILSEEKTARGKIRRWNLVEESWNLGIGEEGSLANSFQRMPIENLPSSRLGLSLGWNSATCSSSSGRAGSCPGVLESAKS